MTNLAAPRQVEPADGFERRIETFRPRAPRSSVRRLAPTPRTCHQRSSQRSG
jgi:hypothetical protein